MYWEFFMSKLYRKHTRSRYEFPTIQIKGGSGAGHLAAKKDIENALKRPLHKDTKVKKASGNWVFLEPRD